MAALPPFPSAVKLQFPAFLPSERRKAGNVGYAAGAYGGNLSDPILDPFFPSFACWSVVGRGLVPQNGGWPCVTDNWVEKISIHNKHTINRRFT